MQKIIFSIIVPHYNSSEKLERLLDSIPSKSDVEVIIVDDFSDDIEKTKKIVKYHKNTKLLFNNGVKGAGTCRNIGVTNAIGKWLLFADADDFFLEEMYGIITKYKDSSYDLIYFVPTSVDDTTHKIASRHVGCEKRINDYLSLGREIDELVLKVKTVQPWSKLIKRELVVNNEIKFDETIRANDVMFSSKVAYLAKSFLATKEIIYCCTRNDKSLTTKGQYRYLEAICEVFTRQYFFWKERLTTRQFEMVDLNARRILEESLSFECPVRSFISSYIYFKAKKVRVFPRKMFNFKFWFRYVYEGMFVLDFKDIMEKKQYYNKNK